MEDNINYILTDCKRCKSSACNETVVDGTTYWHCMTCGFVSNTNLVLDSEFEKNYKEGLPELYKSKRYVDSNDYVWYPSLLQNDSLGMLFLDGTNSEDSEWVVVRPKDEDKTKMDFTNRKAFGDDYMEAFFFWVTNKVEEELV